MMNSDAPAVECSVLPGRAPARLPRAAARLGLTGAEADALASLTRALGSVLVCDVTTEPVALPAPVRAPEAAVRTAKCGCCGMRRDLVAFTVQTAGRPDLCRACGHDATIGRDCTSKPRTYTQTFNASDWTV